MSMSRRRKDKPSGHLAAMLLVIVAIFVAVGAMEDGPQESTAADIAAMMREQEEAEQREAAMAVFLASCTDPDDVVPPQFEGEDPDEAEKIEAALVAQGYFSDVVPLTYHLQDIARTESTRWGCPYTLTLAAMECESQFDSNAVGAVGEIGLMQLNPGPGGKYHAALLEATGMDPATPEGNIAGGCHLLGTYLAKYGDTTKALMAYNAGPGGAAKQWAAGITSTEHTDKVLAAMARWEAVVE